MANPLNNLMFNNNNIIEQFNKFKQNFQGNPQQTVQELLNSGRMTQNQFNQLSQMATQFQQMITNAHGYK